MMSLLLSMRHSSVVAVEADERFARLLERLPRLFKPGLGGCALRSCDRPLLRCVEGAEIAVREQ